MFSQIRLIYISNYTGILFVLKFKAVIHVYSLFSESIEKHFSFLTSILLLLYDDMYFDVSLINKNIRYSTLIDKKHN